MATDPVKLLDALTYVRRHTTNPQMLMICDALSARLMASSVPVPAITVSVDAPKPPVSADSAQAECPTCVARRKADAARKSKTRNRRGKAAHRPKKGRPLSSHRTDHE